jgi:glycosyltransferase involved in cell wall biosynthesis
MNILFITPSYKPAYVYGGPAVSVSELAESLAAIGHSVTIYTTTANGKEELPVATGVPLPVGGVTVYYFKRQSGDHTHVSVGLWRTVWKTAGRFDIIHLQSWWSLLILGAAAICRLRGWDYLISPRGMLSQYSFRNQHGLAKKLIHRFFGRPLLRRSRLHATTRLEWDDCAAVNPRWEGFILPNIIRFPKAEGGREARPAGPITLGFLSRIDPKKGLELLLPALAQVNFDYRLKIAGSGEEAYISSLQALARELGIAENIEWCGWKAGEEKYQFLRGVDLFVLTSHNENFANTVIESLAVGTPVLLSKGVGLADYVNENALGWVCETSVASITQTLHKFHSEKDRLSTISEEAPLRIQRDFEKLALAARYGEAYRRLCSPLFINLTEETQAL